MAASAASQRLERVEKFLDNIDKVKTPSDLQEPFRSMWLRMHGERPTMMSDERKEAFLTGSISGEMLGNVEISSAERKDGKDHSMEFVSPKDVGPTVQMEVPEKKVTFKKAPKDAIDNMEARERSADLMISLQRNVDPISGLGGEVAKVWEGITDIAKEYKAGHYGKAMDLGKILQNKIETNEFKRSVVVQLQKKIGEYEDLGADTSEAKNSFKDLARSLKDGEEDFIEKAGKVNSSLEEAVSDIVEEEVVAQVKAVPEKEAAPKPKPKKLIRRKVRPKPGKEAEEEKEEDTFELDEKEEPSPPKPDHGEEKKDGKQKFVLEEEEKASPPKPVGEEEKKEEPVVKIVTVKKLVPVKKVRKERKEYREQVESEQARRKEDEASGGSDEHEAVEHDQFMVNTGSEEETAESVEEGSGEIGEEAEEHSLSPENDEQITPEEEPVPQAQDEAFDAMKENAPEQESTPAQQEGPSQDEVKKAFEKYQFVYNASLKMHEAGKDMSQLFDLMNYAEQARQNGDLKTYVGVCNQMESMLISLQSS